MPATCFGGTDFVPDTNALREQALLAIVMDDARYAAIPDNVWSKAVIAWDRGQTVACRIPDYRDGRGRPRVRE